ncbi:MAG: ATP-binding protein [Candidatus Sedimenticola sp. (ex Thyasira tokunagai)]
MKNNFTLTLIKVFLTLLILSSALWQTARLSKENALAELEQEGRHQLSLYISHLQGRLDKFESLPELLATNKRLAYQLQHPQDREGAEALSRDLEKINQISGAADTYLMNSGGLTVAASNWQSERPFVGRNFSYRPYFREAMEGRLGRYFALGSTSQRRGYYFAYPVRHQQQVLGVVVIKFDISQIEQDWSLSDDRFLVTDPDGVIFITTEGDWRFKSLQPLSTQAKDRIRAGLRYVDTEIEPLALSTVESIGTAIRIVELGPEEGRRFLMLEHEMPEAGWKVHILTSYKTVSGQMRRSLLLVLSLFTVLLLPALYLNQRRRRLLERAEFARRAKRDLELRVRERTQELTESNTRLSSEIEEHRQTGKALQQTQDELIQAAKMAVVGQMATGISHELNQPLAAIRSYADNSRALLQRERKEEACWNLQQISQLTERMATISSQLKLFARKTSGQLVSVSLPAAIDYSLKILAPRIKEVSAEVRLQLPQQEIFLQADMVQLEQVFVNLISNALHAVEEGEQRIIEISGSQRKHLFHMAIRDSGCGIEEAHLKRLFDPFFTTKSESSGLGLGLSISHRIVEGMGGTLEAKNHPEGGAVFILEMPLAAAPEGN